MDMRLAIVVLPVHEVDRAKAFYRSIGFREDLDYASGIGFRVVRCTPPGSATSVVFGEGITAAVPGSVEGLILAVQDIAQARADLRSRGVAVSEVFHDAGGVFYHLAPAFLASGPDPSGRDNASFARFCDPDGNGWVIQQVQQAEPNASHPDDRDHPGPVPWEPRARATGTPSTLAGIRGRPRPRTWRSP
jgi:catechol 2,3-dioxygenase-like lactoylglutathione lyase family enzyme